PFNFFMPEQKALGKIIMHKMDGEHGNELDTISLYDFKECLSHSPLKDSQAVKQTLDALRKASHASEIAGIERLVEAQNHVIDLLEYMEEKEGFTLFHGKREKCTPPPGSKPRRRYKSQQSTA
ncbi:MAG: hypothetical protein ACK2T0_14560, partial [Anaerolineales bacterium]